MKPFAAEFRDQLRTYLLELARQDPRVSAAAITGSTACGRQDRWSDIDLAFGVKDPSLMAAVIADFSAFMGEQGALHHHDVPAGAWLYRVFFLPGGLQVDLAFVEQGEFRPIGPAFQLVLGEAKPMHPFPGPTPRELVGWAWLHALHARSCILRGKLWQAEYMVSAARDNTLALACIRLGLPSEHGRGMDLLPDAVTRPLQASLAASLDVEHLWLALEVVLESLAGEICQAEPQLGARVSGELRSLASQPGR